MAVDDCDNEYEWMNGDEQFVGFPNRHCQCWASRHHESGRDVLRISYITLIFDNLVCTKYIICQSCI